MGDRPPPVSEVEFCIGDLAAVRWHASAQGRRMGLSAARGANFALAVNEVATNAVRYGSERARLRTWTRGGALCCEVHASGRWVPASLLPRRNQMPPGGWGCG